MGVEAASPVSTDDAPSGALHRLDEITQAVQVGGLPCLLLDFDGTLARIVAHPMMARLEPGMQGVLRSWASQVPVAVISGRDVKDVKERVGVEEVVCVGDHGLVAWMRGEEVLAPVVRAEHLSALDRVAKRVEQALRGVDGAWVEKKRCTLSVHMRQVAPERKGEVEKAVDQVLEDVRGLRKGHGKEVVEVRPDVAWDKGDAAIDLLERWDGRRRSGDPDEGRSIRCVPVVVGDDVSDEAMFRTIGDRGVTVFVGGPGRPTAARYRVADPGQVRELLVRLGGRLGIG